MTRCVPKMWFFHQVTPLVLQWFHTPHHEPIWSSFPLLFIRRQGRMERTERNRVVAVAGVAGVRWRRAEGLSQVLHRLHTHPFGWFWPRYPSLLFFPYLFFFPLSSFFLFISRRFTFLVPLSSSYFSLCHHVFITSTASPSLSFVHFLTQSFLSHPSSYASTVCNAPIHNPLYTTQALNITQGVDMVEDSLPKAHTCFNQLVLPPYSSFAKLKERILFAVANSEGFELA